MKKIVILTVLLLTLAGSFGSALASGYPVVVLAADSSSTILVLGKFHSTAGQFTMDEANGLVLTVSALVQSLLGTTGNVAVLSPSQMAGYGLPDADSDKNLAKLNYPAWGVDIFVFVDISKTAETVAGYGPNMRLDVHIADLAAALSLPGDYLYAASIEVPYLYVQMLNSLL